MSNETLPDKSLQASKRDHRTATLLDVALDIVRDAHHAPREYIRRANTQQQGE